MVGRVQLCSGSTWQQELGAHVHRLEWAEEAAPCLTQGKRAGLFLSPHSLAVLGLGTSAFGKVHAGDILGVIILESGMSKLATQNRDLVVKNLWLNESGGP